MVAPFRRRAEPAAVTRTPEQEAEHEVALVIQGQYRRRIGETLEIVNAAGNVETVRIQNINAGDDHAEVIIVHANKRVETIPAVTLAEQETLAAERAAVATGGASRVIRLGNAAEVTDIAGSTKKKFKMRYGAVDVSEAVEERARDSAEETLHREKAEVSGISGFIAKIWKHNVAYEIYRQVGIARARNKILTDKNLYTNEGLQKADHQRAVAAVVDRCVEEHQNSLHQQGADGERKKKLETSPAEVAVKAKLNDLVREFAANPAMDEDELEKRKLSIFKEANELAGEAKGRGVMVADNMIEIAKAVREHALHAGGIDNLDIDLEFVIGKAKMGARTERERSAIDKALDGMDRLTSKHGITAGIWGATRSGAAVAGAIGLTMAQMVAKSNIAKVVTFGGSALATGLFSWWREKGRTNREHALHERQRALGGLLRAEQTVEELNAEEIQLNRQLAATKWWQPVDRANLRARIDKVRNTKQPRREEMDKFAMHRLNARDLSDRGQAFLTPDGQLKPGLDPADAMRALADMEARVSIGNIEKKDLLQYSGVAEVEIERRDLDETRMVLKAALRAANANFEADYNGIYNGVVGVITDHKNTQQKKFDEYAKKRAKNAALIAVGSGMAVGLAAHEVWELANGGDGLSMLRGVGTFQQWLMSYISSTPDALPLPTGAPVMHTFTDGAINTPPGTELLQQADGSWSLQAAADHRVIADGLHIGSNGSLDAASVQALERLGATVAQQDVMTDNVTTVTEEIGVWDWLRGHAPDVSHVHRDIWMGNDTPAPVFDFNEQGLHWGQVNGVSADGDAYTMSLSTMTRGGSWQNGLHIDPLQETANGNMRLVLTLSEGSQNHAITLTPDADGNFTIPMNSDIGRTLFTTDESVIAAALARNPSLHHVPGEPFFLGKHAEIAMSRGIDDAGVEHLAILATHTGSGLDHGVITRDIGECVERHLTQIRLPNNDLNPFPPIILPPIIPIRARTPMERLATRKPGPRGAFAGGDPRGSLMDDVRHAHAYYGSGYNAEDPESKRYFTEISQYRASGYDRMMAKTLEAFNTRPELVSKYRFVLKRLESLRNFDRLTVREKEKIEEERRIFNLRYHGSETSRYLSVDEYIARQIMRVYRQIENILLEEATVGEKPFPPEFYTSSPFIKGIERAEEIVLMMNPAIGDAVLSTPIILALSAYFKQNGMAKSVVVVTKQPSLFKSLEKQYGGMVELVAEKDLSTRFSRGADKERFILNSNTYFTDYSVFGLNRDQVQDTTRVMSIDCTSWTTEEAPMKAGTIKKYDPLPARIIRNIEEMVGQKLVEDIHKLDHFLEKGDLYDAQSQEIKTKYNIAAGEKILVISPGSSVTPKEWMPERWSEMLKSVRAKYPGVHVLWLEDPNQQKRELYGAMVDQAKTEGLHVSRVTEGLPYMNTIMSMADLVITPDTGLGHLAGALGKKNIMLTLVNPVQWSTGNTVRVMHRKAYEVYKKGGDTYGLMWGQPTDFYVDDNGKKIGASDIPPEAVFEKVEKILG